MPKLTKKLVDGLKPQTREYMAWDSGIKGFGVRVWPEKKSGADAGKCRKVYLLKYRVGGGRGGTIRKPAIGVHGTITCTKAREIAEDWAGRVAEGGDPGQDRQDQREAPTVNELCEHYIEEYAERHKGKRSVEEDRRNIKLHIKPALGRKKVTTATGDDVRQLYRSMRDKPIGANRVLALLRMMFNLIETDTLGKKWKLRPVGSNPCRSITKIEKYPERSRERFLSADEWEGLADALKETEEPANVVVAIRLLIFTGCRLSEILTLKWEHVDLENARLCLPESKTGAKVVYLNAPALEVLAGIKPPENNPYVIVGRKPGSHLTDLQKPWRRIRQMARLDTLRLHDLRHSFASTGASAGLSLPIIGAMLGHAQINTTERYAHLSADPVRQASEAIGATIAAAMEGKKAEVVKISHHKR